MNWTEAIENWKAEHIAKYGKGETATRVPDSYYGYRTINEPYIVLPEQDITVTYNGKELCHYNGDYKNGAIKKAVMSKVIAKHGKTRVYEDEAEAYNTVMQAEGQNVKVKEIEG